MSAVGAGSVVCAETVTAVGEATRVAELSMLSVVLPLPLPPPPPPQAVSVDATNAMSNPGDQAEIGRFFGRNRVVADINK